MTIARNTGEQINQGTEMAAVAVISDTYPIGKHRFHAVGEKYLAAVRDAAGALPLSIPALPDPVDFDSLFTLVDGIMMTGALSNVHPDHYGGDTPRPGTMEDRLRDATALPLIQEALKRGVPLLCICRGFQELNVALGGTLHPHLWEVKGRFDHRENHADPLEVQYGPAHKVKLSEDGQLRGMFGVDEIMVNSLHGQGLDRIADDLAVEGVAEDGTVEAVRVKGVKSFAFGVQWHPEWKPAETPHHAQLFRAFGDAVKAHKKERVL